MTTAQLKSSENTSVFNVASLVVYKSEFAIPDDYHQLQKQAKNVIHSQKKYKELAMERLEIIWRFAEVQPALKQNQRLNLCSF